MNKVSIPVDVSEGMFSNEYVVAVTLFNGNRVSFFLDKYLVEEKEGKHYIKAMLYEKNEQEGKMRIFLPRAAFETCSAHAEVPLYQ
jgi:hypothetical protein